MKSKHIVVGALMFLLGGRSFLIVYGIVLCYYLFCKGFMVKTYYPTFIDAVGLSREYGRLKSQNKIDETLSDSKFRQYLKDNTNFVENRLWFLYQQNKEAYEKQIKGTSSFAFVVFPLILLQYFSLRKLNKHLKERIDKDLPS